MTKYQFRESDIYLPGTDVPVNLLGIEEPEILHVIEAELLERAYVQAVEDLSPHTRFDEAYFRSLHRNAFESLYAWAGEYRDVDMAKGESMFCRGAYVPREAARLFGQLAEEDFLREASHWPDERFAERMGWYQGELIALHPFFELNGRITRLFFDLIAIYNGYGPIDYGRSLTADEGAGNNYIRASILSVQHADHSLLTRLILQGLEPMSRGER